MLRVHSIFFMRTVVRPLVVKASVCVFGLVSLSFFVSVPHVLNNMITSGSFLSFIRFAVTHTEIYVQALLFLVVCTAVLVCKDTIMAVGMKYRSA